MSPERIARADANVEGDALAIRLQLVREAAGMTQQELGKKAHFYQPQLSRLERSGNAEITTLIRYVAALGGRLEMSAVLKNGKRLQLLRSTTSAKRKVSKSPRKTVSVSATGL